MWFFIKVSNKVRLGGKFAVRIVGKIQKLLQEWGFEDISQLKKI